MYTRLFLFVAGERTALGNLNLLGVGKGGLSSIYALSNLWVDLDAGLEVSINCQLLTLLVGCGNEGGCSRVAGSLHVDVHDLSILVVDHTHMMIGLNQK